MFLVWTYRDFHSIEDTFWIPRRHVITPRKNTSISKCRSSRVTFQCQRITGNKNDFLTDYLTVLRQINLVLKFVYCRLFKLFFIQIDNLMSFLSKLKAKIFQMNGFLWKNHIWNRSLLGYGLHSTHSACNVAWNGTQILR